MVLKEELFEAVKTNKLKNRFDLLKNRRIEDDVTGHRPSVYDKKQIKEEPNEIQDNLYDRLESAVGKHLSVVPGSDSNSWEVTHKNKEVLKPVAKWLRQRGIPYKVSKLWNYYTIAIPFDTIPADFDKRKKSTKEVELKDTVDNISAEDSLDLEEKLVNDEVKDFFKKADKLGIKTMGDLQKLFDKEMSGLKADGTEMSDAEAMSTYYQEANPEDKELKNKSANTLEGLFKELADCEKEISGENTDAEKEVNSDTQVEKSTEESDDFDNRWDAKFGNPEDGTIAVYETDEFLKRFKEMCDFK